MGDSVADFFKSIGGDFVMVVIGSWLAEKLFYSFDAIKFLILDGKIGTGIFIAVLAYGVYYICASVVMTAAGDSGKAAVAVIIAFSLYGMYQDIQAAAGDKQGAEFVGITILYLLYVIDDTLRVIATLHAFADET